MRSIAAITIINTISVSPSQYLIVHYFLSFGRKRGELIQIVSHHPLQFIELMFFRYFIWQNKECVRGAGDEPYIM